MRGSVKRVRGSCRWRMALYFFHASSSFFCAARCARNAISPTPSSSLVGAALASSTFDIERRRTSLAQSSFQIHFNFQTRDAQTRALNPGRTLARVRARAVRLSFCAIFTSFGRGVAALERHKARTYILRAQKLRAIPYMIVSNRA